MLDSLLLDKDGWPLPVTFIPDAGSRLIFLSRGFTTIVSLPDFEKFGGYTWTVQLEKWTRKMYAYRMETIDGRRKKFYLHREIVQPPKHWVADHKNGCGLDNRRGNLRAATYSQNKKNGITSSASGFRGVDRDRRYWRVRIKGPDGVISISGFLTAEAAAKEYDRLAIELHGPFAWLNFPRDMTMEEGFGDAVPF